MIIVWFILSIPWVLLWTVIEFLFPELVFRTCPTCSGQGYIPIENGNDELYKLCDCNGRDKRCPDCHGTQLIKVTDEHKHYTRCPDCRKGYWPRGWAWYINAAPHLGHYRSGIFNRIYAYQGDIDK